MTLQQAVFAGIVDPGNLVGVRELVDKSGNPMGASPNTNTAGDCGAATPVNCDTALFSFAPDAYTVTHNADGSVTVSDNLSAAGLAAGDPFPGGDGVDTLWNMENLRFCIGTDPVSKNCNAFSPDIPLIAPATTGPVVSTSAALLTFGNQNTGTTSAAQTITV